MYISPKLIDKVYNRIYHSLVSADLNGDTPSDGLNGLLDYDAITYKGKMALYYLKKYADKFGTIKFAGKVIGWDIYDKWGEIFEGNTQGVKCGICGNIVPLDLTTTIDSCLTQPECHCEKESIADVPGCKLTKPHNIPICLRCYSAYGVGRCQLCGARLSMAQMRYYFDAAGFVYHMVCLNCIAKEKKVSNTKVGYTEPLGSRNNIWVGFYITDENGKNICANFLGKRKEGKHPVSRNELIEAVANAFGIDNIPFDKPAKPVKKPKTEKPTMIKSYIKQLVKHNFGELCLAVEKMVGPNFLGTDEKVKELTETKNTFEAVIVYPLESDIDTQKVEKLIDKYFNIGVIKNPWDNSGDSWEGEYLNPNKGFILWTGTANVGYSNLSIDTDDSLAITFTIDCDIKVKEEAVLGQEKT